MLGAVTVVAAAGLSGCSSSHTGSTASTSALAASATAAPPPRVASVPPPQALTDVLYRLADPAVPGIEKLNLVEGASTDKAVVLDKFATALRDGGYAPMAFDATDIAWSDRDPTDVVATIHVTAANPEAGGFSFPMEFKPYQGSWQLSQQTAATLLAFGQAAATTSPAPPG